MAADTLSRPSPMGISPNRLTAQPQVAQHDRSPPLGEDLERRHILGAQDLLAELASTPDLDVVANGVSAAVEGTRALSSPLPPANPTLGYPDGGL